MKERYNRSYAIIGRLAERVCTPKQAQAEIETVVAAVRKNNPDRYPQNDSFGEAVYPLKGQGSSAR